MNEDGVNVVRSATRGQKPTRVVATASMIDHALVRPEIPAYSGALRIKANGLNS
jgi:hypothetical protein